MIDYFKRPFTFDRVVRIVIILIIIIGINSAHKQT